MNYILDTNVISELVAAQPDPNVIRWMDEVDPDQVFLSVIAIGELKKGIEKLPGSNRKEILDQWLQEDLLVRFQDHILSIDTKTMLLWGSMVAKLENELASRWRQSMPSLLQQQNNMSTRLSPAIQATLNMRRILLKNPLERLISKV